MRDLQRAGSIWSLGSTHHPRCLGGANDSRRSSLGPRRRVHSLRTSAQRCAGRPGDETFSSPEAGLAGIHSDRHESAERRALSPTSVPAPLSRSGLQAIRDGIGVVIYVRTAFAPDLEGSGARADRPPDHDALRPALAARHQHGALDAALSVARELRDAKTGSRASRTNFTRSITMTGPEVGITCWCGSAGFTRSRPSRGELCRSTYQHVRVPLPPPVAVDLTQHEILGLDEGVHLSDAHRHKSRHYTQRRLVERLPALWYRAERSPQSDSERAFVDAYWHLHNPADRVGDGRALLTYAASVSTVIAGMYLRKRRLSALLTSRAFDNLQTDFNNTVVPSCPIRRALLRRT